MLGVQLPTCVSSPVQSTNVRLEFSPIVPRSVLFCFWVGQNYLESRTALSTKALCLSPVHVAVNIHLLLVWLTILPSSPLLLRVSVPVSGLPVSTMIFWKGVSFPLGMAINLISLLWTILHSSHRRWLLHRLHFGLHMRRGKRVRLRKLHWWTSLLQILLRPISPPRTALLWALRLGLVCIRSGRSQRFCLLLFLRTALLLALLPRLRRSVHCARVHALLVVRKGPWSFCDRGRCFTRGDWRSSWFAERQVCSVHSVPLFNNISPFFCPLIIDPAGRAVPAGSNWGVLRRLDTGIRGDTQPGMSDGYSSWYGYFWTYALDWNAGCLSSRRRALAKRLWLSRSEATWIQLRDFSKAIFISAAGPDNGHF